MALLDAVAAGFLALGLAYALVGPLRALAASLASTEPGASPYRRVAAWYALSWGNPYVTALVFAVLVGIATYLARRYIGRPP